MSGPAIREGKRKCQHAFSRKYLPMAPAGAGSHQRVRWMTGAEGLMQWEKENRWRWIGLKKQVLTRIPCRLKYPDALLDRRAGVAFVVGRVDAGEEGDVDAEGLGGAPTRLADGLSQGVGGGLG